MKMRPGVTGLASGLAAAGAGAFHFGDLLFQFGTSAFFLFEFALGNCELSLTLPALGLDLFELLPFLGFNFLQLSHLDGFGFPNQSLALA